MIFMLRMSEKSKAFLAKWLPGFIDANNVNDVLDQLYLLIESKGFDKDDEYNDFGNEAQEVYDDIYDSN